jgi:hypothetical protein
VWQEVCVTLPDGATSEKIFIGMDRSRSEATKSRNLKILLDIIKAKLPGQPIAKLNREAAITKSWKSLAELKPHSNYGKISGKPKLPPPNLSKVLLGKNSQKASDNMIEEKSIPPNSLAWTAAPGNLMHRLVLPALHATTS